MVDGHSYYEEHMEQNLALESQKELGRFFCFSFHYSINSGKIYSKWNVEYLIKGSKVILADALMSQLF